MIDDMLTCEPFVALIVHDNTIQPRTKLYEARTIHAKREMVVPCGGGPLGAPLLFLLFCTAFD
jgi:hypothetical protein